jgi:hypothetical protein
MTGVGGIATALMCCFEGVYGVFYALYMRRGEETTKVVTTASGSGGLICSREICLTVQLYYPFPKNR